MARIVAQKTKTLKLETLLDRLGVLALLAVGLSTATAVAAFG